MVGQIGERAEGEVREEEEEVELGVGVGVGVVNVAVYQASCPARTHLSRALVAGP